MSPRRPEPSDYYQSNGGPVGSGPPLSEDELLTGYGIPSGVPVDIHTELRVLAQHVDAIALELVTVRALLELLVADAELAL